MIRDRSDFAQRLFVSLFCIGTILGSADAYSVEIQAQFNGGIGKSDNVRNADDRSEEPIEETIGVVGLDFGLTEESSRLSADIRSNFDYFYYADDTFDNELVGGLNGTLNFTLIDERLTWLVQDTFGQQAADAFVTANPGNRQNVNFFTTGPTLSLLPGSRNQVEIDLRYSSVNFEDFDNDSERTLVTLRLGREIRRGATVSLNATTERIEFDNDGLSPDFDRLEGFVRYGLGGNRNTLGVDVGYTEIDIDGEVQDGVLVRINWSREVSPDTTFSISGGTRYSDQGDIFRFAQNNSVDLRDTSDNVPCDNPESGDPTDVECRPGSTSAPFTSNFFALSYGLNSDRTAVNIGLNWSQEDYKGGPPLDRDVTQATLGIRRDIARSTFVGLSLRYRRRDFKYLGTVDDNTSFSAELGFRFGPSSSVSLEYRFQERSGDSSVTESRENRIFLRYLYTPAWGR